MKKLNITFLLTMLMSMVGLNASAHYIEVKNAEGVTIYYNYINNSTELAVTYRGTSYTDYSNEYTGNVVIPESVTYNEKTYSVTSIRSNAFRGCSGLSSITIPKSVTSIGVEAFSECSGLTSIKVQEGNSFYDSRNNCNAIIETSSNTLIAGCKNTIIPNNVTIIENCAFLNCPGLTSITIPNSVTSIEERAFEDCLRLTSIYSYIENPTSNTGSKFDSSNYTDATLYVPSGTKDKYLATAGWKKFTNIVEIGGTAVKDISASNINEAKSFSIDGKRLSQPQKGLNILKMSDGTTRKVVK